LCNPVNFDTFLISNGYSIKIIFEQHRNLNPIQLNDLTSGLKDYFLFLREENKCHFDIQDKIWTYKVWLKKITLNFA
jgi:hypothetical protein